MFEFTIDALSLLRKNEENNMKILSLESQLHASKTSLRQIDDLKMQCNEQKNEIYGLKINNEDLRNRLEISLHSNEELIKKHNDEINSINSHRIAEISQIRNHFFEKDREKEAMISKLKKEIDKMKKEKNNQLLDMMKIFQNQSSKDNKNDAKSENNQNAPFSIHIQKKNEENPNLKWKNKYNEEKRKRKELKKENEQLIQNSEMQQKTINELKHQLEEKQNQVNSLQTETSIIQHEIRQSIGHSIISEDSNISEIQSNNLQSLKLKLSKALSVIDEVKNSNEILSNNVIKGKNRIKKLKLLIKKVKEENKEYQIANEQFKDENEQLYKDNERLTNEIAKNENDNMIFLKENEKLKRSIIKSQDDKSNNFKIIGKMSLIIKTLRKELQNVVNEKTSHIPFDLLPSELITENPDEELTMESIINWYNNRIEYLTKEVNKLDQVKRYVNKKLREASISFDDRDLLLNIEKLNNYHENLSKSNTSVADDDTEKSSTYSSNTKSIKSNNESNS